MNVNPAPSQEKTVTPVPEGMEVTPDDGYLLDSVIVNGDVNLISENIKKDVSIFGVTGSMQAGINIVNSTIKEYCASTETISANTFVQYVAGSYGVAASKQLTTDCITTMPMATPIDDTRVLVSYINSASTACYAVIVTIENTTIIVGTPVSIGNMSNAMSPKMITALYFSNYNKAVVIYNTRMGMPGSCSYSVLTINGTSITVNSSAVAISSDWIDRVSKISDTQFIGFGGANAYIYNFNGTSISKSTTKTMSFYVNDILKISSSSYLCLGRDPNDDLTHLMGMVVDINGTTITENTLTEIYDGRNSGTVTSAVKLEDGRYFIAHSQLYTGNNSEILYGSTITINNKTITKGFTAVIDAGQSSTNYCTGKIITAGLMEGNKIIILHTQTSNNNLKVTVLTVGSSSFSKEQNVAVNTSVSNDNVNWNLIMLPSGRAYIVYGMTNSILTNQLKGTIKTATSATALFGFTKTEATTSSAGEVCVLA